MTLGAGMLIFIHCSCRGWNWGKWTIEKGASTPFKKELTLTVVQELSGCLMMKCDSITRNIQEEVQRCCNVTPWLRTDMCISVTWNVLHLGASGANVCSFSVSPMVMPLWTTGIPLSIIWIGQRVTVSQPFFKFAIANERCTPLAMCLAEKVHLNHVR